MSVPYVPVFFPQVAKEQPFLPLQDVATAAGASLHTSSVSKRLNRAGLQTFKPCGALNLTERHKADRLLFATESLRQRTPDFWKSVIFTDEKIFRTDSCGRVRVRRPRGARYDERYAVSKDSSGRENVHVWAWIDGHGCGELHRIIGRHVAATYVEILEDVLLPSLEAMRPGGAPYVLQQDNAPQHSARVTKCWLAQHANVIKVLNWPGKSPDLNTIENIWGILEQEVGEENREERPSADELWRRVDAAWDGLRSRPGLFETLAGSMVRRLEDVVEAAGGLTKY